MLERLSCLLISNPQIQLIQNGHQQSVTFTMKIAYGVGVMYVEHLKLWTYLMLSYPTTMSRLSFLSGKQLWLKGRKREMLSKKTMSKRPKI